MGLFSSATNHLEGRIEERLRKAYNLHAAMAVRHTLREAAEQGHRQDVATMRWSVAMTHDLAWNAAMREVDPRRELSRSLGDEKLMVWLKSIVGDFFASMLDLPPDEAYSFVREAVHDLARTRAEVSANGR